MRFNRLSSEAKVFAALRYVSRLQEDGEEWNEHDVYDVLRNEDTDYAADGEIKEKEE